MFPNKYTILKVNINPNHNCVFVTYFVNLNMIRYDGYYYRGKDDFRDYCDIGVWRIKKIKNKNNE